MRAKYNCGLHTVPEVRIRHNSSATWRAMAQVWDVVNSNITWVIRNGQGTRFWKDSWIPKIGGLQNYLATMGPEHELDFPIAHYAQNGSWEWERL